MMSSLHTRSEQMTRLHTDSVPRGELSCGVIINIHIVSALWPEIWGGGGVHQQGLKRVTMFPDPALHHHVDVQISDNNTKNGADVDLGCPYFNEETWEWGVGRGVGVEITCQRCV